MQIIFQIKFRFKWKVLLRQTNWKRQRMSQLQMELSMKLMTDIREVYIKICSIIETVLTVSELNKPKLKSKVVKDMQDSNEKICFGNRMRQDSWRETWKNLIKHACMPLWDSFVRQLESVNQGLGEQKMQPRCLEVLTRSFKYKNIIFWELH